MIMNRPSIWEVDFLVPDFLSIEPEQVLLIEESEDSQVLEAWFPMESVDGRFIRAVYNSSEVTAY
jgi:hypothetical protein